MSSRGNSWTDEETLCLLSIWKDHKIQAQMDGTVRNSAVMRKITDLLQQQGIERTVQQVKGKMKKLRESFRKAEDNNRTSGRGRKTCRYYEELAELLGGRPETNPIGVVSSVSLESSLGPVPDDSTDSLQDEDDIGSVGDDTPEQDMSNGDIDTTPPELVGNFVDGDVLNDSSSSGSGSTARTSNQGSKKGGTKRKKSKLQQSMESMAKYMRTLDEESAVRHERSEDRRMECERELEERRREEDRQFRARERELDRQHQLHMLQLVTTAFQNRPPWPTEAPYIGHPEGRRLDLENGQPSEPWGQSFPGRYTPL